MLLRTFFILGLSSIVLAQTDQPEYGGPSILSRGLSASVLARQQNVRLRPNIGVNGFCDDGLAGFTVGRDGKVPNQLACGVSAELGVYGYHLWRKSQLGLR